MVFENNITISGKLDNLKYTNDGVLIGVLKQNKLNIDGKELIWYFPFIITNLSPEIKKKISDIYLNETELESGIDLPFLKNDSYELFITGALSFNNVDKDVTKLFEDLINKVPEQKKEIENILEIIKPRIQETYIHVWDNKVKFKQNNK